MSKNFLFFIFFISLLGPKLLKLQEKFYFIHITDMHVSTIPYFTELFDYNANKANCYFNYFFNLNTKPAFIVASGDISNFGHLHPTGMYHILTNILYPKNIFYPNPGDLYIDSTLLIPIYFAPGNHDYYSITYLPEGGYTFLPFSLEYYSYYLSPDTDYFVLKDNLILISLRSGPDSTSGDYMNSPYYLGSGLTIEQCNWLRDILYQNVDKRKVIFMHHCPWNLANNKDVFVNICDSAKVDVVLCGHTHQNTVKDKNFNNVDENFTGGTRFIETAAAIDLFYREITIEDTFVFVSQPKIVTDCISNINKKYSTNEILFYDPIKKIIKVNLNSFFTLRIYDTKGLLLYEESKELYKEDININFLKTGIYIVDILDKNLKQSFKYKIVIF